MENKQTLRETIDRFSNVARFAKCLGISRPSLYKYIEKYDSGDQSTIPNDILTTFNTIISGNDDFKMVYFNDLYSRYLDKNGQAAESVPKDIARKIDSLELTVEDVDEWIEHSQKEKDELEAAIETRGLDRRIHESDLAWFDKRLEDLEYTRELVELRTKERHFIAVKEGKMDWIASTGPRPIDVCRYNEEELKYNPELEKAFKCCKAKTEEGYMFYFAGSSEDDHIVVNVVTSRGWNEGICERIASFSPDKRQYFVKIPRIFDDAHEYAFNYEVERYRDGMLLNHLEGFFQR